MGRTKNYDGTKYPAIRSLYKSAFPQKSKKEADKMCNIFWNENKKSADVINAKIEELKRKTSVISHANPVFDCFQKSTKKTSVVSYSTDQAQATTSTAPHDEPEDSSHEIEQDEDPPSYNRPRHRQEALNEKLSTSLKELELLREMRNKGFGLSHDQTDRMKQLKKDSKQQKSQLKRLEMNRVAAMRSRDKRKHAVNPTGDIQTPLNRGRPRLERDQPGLLDAILDAVSSTASADEKRRTEKLRTVTTLDSLLQNLQEMGFTISRSGLYLRLLPRNVRSVEGARHVKTVPVKLARAQNSMRSAHPDTHFAAAQIRHIKDLCELLGPSAVLVISQDDKAKVPIGITAAQCQGPILMKMDYEVRLPDHNFPVAQRHVLIPSVYSGLEFKERKLSYSGPTYIAIRSGKHDSSTAETHRQDIETFLALQEFTGFTRRHGEVKPIVVQLVDGGGDQRPANEKTLKQAIRNFKKYNLDAIFVATHAPCQSASNPVERRMAPLSRKLSGVILPYDSYGNHLDKSRKTKDKNLEIRNFNRAGRTLAEIWNDMEIDGHKVVAKYIPPPGSVYNDDDESESENINGSQSQEMGLDEEFHATEEWLNVHVRQSKYLIQISKCFNSSCCSIHRTNFATILKNRFLPPPILYEQTGSGIMCAEVESKTAHFYDLFTRLSLECIRPDSAPNPIPNDLYCPSIAKDIKSYLCSTCGLYLNTKTKVKNHKKIHRQTLSALTSAVSDEEIVEEDLEDTNLLVVVLDDDELDDDEMPEIHDVNDWWSAVFVDVDGD